MPAFGSGGGFKGASIGRGRVARSKGARGRTGRYSRGVGRPAPKSVPGGGRKSPTSTNLGNDIIQFLTDRATRNIMRDVASPGAKLKKIKKATRAILDNVGFGARNIARTKVHTPWKTGTMARATQWQRAKIRGGVISGKLYNNVTYARKQEFRNKTKPFFMYRALVKSSGYLNKVFGNEGGNIVLGLLPGNTGGVTAIGQFAYRSGQGGGGLSGATNPEQTQIAV